MLEQITPKLQELFQACVNTTVANVYEILKLSQQSFPSGADVVFLEPRDYWSEFEKHLDEFKPLFSNKSVLLLLLQEKCVQVSIHLILLQI